MLVTLTNTSGTTLNAVGVHDGGSGATGGAVTNRVPYPFGHIAPLAASGTVQLAMHPQDWRYKRVPWLTFEPREDWNIMIQAGKATLTVAAQTGRRDQEELFIAALD